MNDPFGTLQELDLGGGERARYHALPALERAGFGQLGRLPVSIRIVLESLLRNCDGRRVREEDVRALAGWSANGERSTEVPFVVGRVLLQDFTGVPLLVDLAAMRSALQRLGQDPRRVEPTVPVDLIVDHSVQVDVYGRPDALQRNMEIELTRNRRRYEFLKWGAQAFQTLHIVPPGLGICHQVNLEYLSQGVLEREGTLFPDTLVGTDSHTTMVNGLGVLGWGVGGIEAEAAMLGQPNYFLAPDVVGVHLAGALPEGVTATDLVLTVTELLRKARVVGKFVEFHGEGARTLSAPTRATLANMAPEYGATVGFFPIDEETLRYLEETGRTHRQIERIHAYYRAQGLFGIPRRGDCDYSSVVELDLSSVRPSVSGPKRPQDRIALPQLPDRFQAFLTAAPPDGLGHAREEATRRAQTDLGADGEARPGGGQQDPETMPSLARLETSSRDTNPLTEREMMNNRPTPDRPSGPNHVPQPRFTDLGHGDIVIAAITSCTNTSNPDVMLAAGLVAKKAVELGLKVNPRVKTSLAPGSRIVTHYLERAGLLSYLEALGFGVVGYGCTTCIGNSGPLDPEIEDLIIRHELVCAAVLSGNRNFEARIHQSVKANFLMSPPLVVAFALAGSVSRDLERDPIGIGHDGRVIFLRDLWPSQAEIDALLGAARDPEAYRANYAQLMTPSWQALPAPAGEAYAWDLASTYIREPPYFDAFSPAAPSPHATAATLLGARALALFGDSVTTDHISPAGAIKPSSPAGQYLQEQGIAPNDFNSYGARRGNHEVMVRGTFANVRIKNLMVPGVEGGVTLHLPDRLRMPIHQAALAYAREGIPLIVLAGQEYGTGSSRDWAAKGTRLLGVRAVIARSFERIHRSNLVGMGVLPCQFPEGTSLQSLRLDGSERYDLLGLDGELQPRQLVTLVIHRSDESSEGIPLTLRIDTPIEVEYYRHGGILPYVLRSLARPAQLQASTRLSLL